MRNFSYAVLVLLISVVPASAQPQENLDTVLRGWEKAMVDLKSFYAQVDRTTTDTTFGSTEFNGYAMFLKAKNKNDASRARLQLTKSKNEKVFEKYICTGVYLYEYAPVNNTVRVHDMPQNKPGAKQQESFLSFLFGMGAEQAKDRYEMKLAYPTNKETKKEFMDPNYHYIVIKPKLDQDKSDFTEARLSLYRSNNLPAQIWYLQPTKSQITWNFTKLHIDKEIPLEYFEPTIPKDWRMERVQSKAPAGVQPVIRNKP